MRKKQKRKEKKERNNKILIIIIITIISLIIILFSLNILLREKIVLNNNQKQALEKIFPQEHINKIKVWNGGIVSLGSTRTLCKSIYLKKNIKLNESEYISLLIHETTHTYQGKNLITCIKMSISSLYNQLKYYIKHGSRDEAYYYEYNKTPSNPEQEAALIEDYYSIKYMNYSIANFCQECLSENIEDCYSCEHYPIDEQIQTFETITNKILEKYN